MLMHVTTGTYRFNQGFGLVIAHRHIMHPVLKTEVTHHLFRSIKHLPEVREEPKTTAERRQKM